MLTILLTVVIGAIVSFYMYNYTLVFDLLENVVRTIVTKVVTYLPVKVIRDENGIPFLYRYHLFAWGSNGWGLCIHNFVKSDPERGYHDHPWFHSLSFILCGEYDERILTPQSIERSKGQVDKSTNNSTETPVYTVHKRSRWTFNYLNGVKTFHRVMIAEHTDVWTLFVFGPRAKTWNMIGLNSTLQKMSQQVEDTDGGWWKWVRHGFRNHLPIKGVVSATVDIVLFNHDRTKVVLIKRGREPFEGCWAFPGGRIEPSDTTILDAAKRELLEETNLKDIDLTVFTTVGDKTRDPRGFVISVVFTGILQDDMKLRAGDDAVDIAMFPVDDQTVVMAFDHRTILNQILNCS